MSEQLATKPKCYPRAWPEFLSKEWRELYKHTIHEAARLGLEVSVNFCASGWTMGGPWITPEKNGGWFVQSEMKIKGPQCFTGKLPVPNPRGGYKPPYQFNVKLQMEWPNAKMDYMENAVAAFQEQLKPHYKRMIQRFKDVNPDTITIPHRDGAVEELLDDNKEIGFEVFNPVLQGVPCHLSQDLTDNFGDNFAFWGAIDQQDLLPNEADEELENDFSGKINILG